MRNHKYNNGNDNEVHAMQFFEVTPHVCGSLPSDRHESSYMYSGRILFPPTSPYRSTIVTRENLSCRDCVEAQYYSACLIKFKPVCSHCGGPEETLVEDKLVQGKKAIYSTNMALKFTQHALLLLTRCCFGECTLGLETFSSSWWSDPSFWRKKFTISFVEFIVIIIVLL